MPTDADARPKDHSDNSTQAEGSQLRSIHGGLRGWPISSETKMRASPSTSCEQPKLPTPPPFELARVELRALAITPLEFPITPLRITVAMAQPGRHLPTVPTSLLALSGPTGGVLTLFQPSLPPEPLNCRTEPPPLGWCAPKKFAFAALVGLELGWRNPPELGPLRCSPPPVALRAEAGGAIAIADKTTAAIAAVARIGRIPVARPQCRSTRDEVGRRAPVVNINRSNSIGPRQTKVYEGRVTFMVRG